MEACICLCEEQGTARNHAEGCMCRKLPHRRVQSRQGSAVVLLHRRVQPWQGAAAPEPASRKQLQKQQNHDTGSKLKDVN
eukprot:1143037-Pelagomonas_calceolata.AAC.9